MQQLCCISKHLLITRCRLEAFFFYSFVFISQHNIFLYIFLTLITSFTTLNPLLPLEKLVF